MTPAMGEALHLLAEHDGRGLESGGGTRAESGVAWIHWRTVAALRRHVDIDRHAQPPTLQLTDVGWRAVEELLGDRRPTP